MLNHKKYNGKLVEVVPTTIESSLECERALELVEKLSLNLNRTPEEAAVYKLLVTLIESYESEHYPMPESSPDEVLRHILEASNTSQSDLAGILGSSSDVSAIISGEKAINHTQAKILGDRFKVSPSLFFA